MKNILMIGVDSSTRGGMWSVVENYLQSDELREQYQLQYLPTACAGSKLRRLVFAAAAMLRFHAAMGSADLVHIHMASRNSFYRKRQFIRVAKRHRKPVIVHIHGAHFRVFYDALPERKKQDVRETLQQADVVLCLGERWVEDLSDIWQGKVRTEVLYNAVPIPAINPYNPNGKDILFLGVIGRRKGVYDILEAVRHIDAQLPPGVVVALYGEGDTAAVADAIGRHGLEKRVELRGWLPLANKPEAFQKAMLNLLPSYNEGLPMTILEAMAMGIPTITTPVGAIAEAVRDGIHGRLVDPGDTDAIGNAILELVLDREGRIRMSGHCHRDALEHFSLDRHIAGLCRIYSELLTS